MGSAWDAPLCSDARQLPSPLRRSSGTRARKGEAARVVGVLLRPRARAASSQLHREDVAHDPSPVIGLFGGNKQPRLLVPGNQIFKNKAMC